MKIASIDVIALKSDPKNFISLRPILCRVNTDEGVYGYGEAAIAIGCGATAVYALLKEYAALIVGMDPTYHEVIWEKLLKSTFWGQGNGAIETAAISAIDMALWDIKGKAAGMPLYKLLGGKQRDQIRCYASQLQFGWNLPQDASGLPHPGELSWYTLNAQRALDDGYDAIKANFIRFHEDGSQVSYLDTTANLSRKLMKTAETRLAAVRELVGPDIDIILENHAMTDAKTAIQFARMAEKYDILFYEECTTPLNPQVMKEVAEHTKIPIASGERIYTRWGFLPYFQNKSISVAQPDIGNCGGITECKKICDMAHVFDISVQTHVCSSPISIAASLHLEAAIPNFIIHEQFFCNKARFMVDYCKYDYQPENGCFSVPELPGIGQELSEKALSEAHIETVSRAGGSFLNK